MLHVFNKVSSRMATISVALDAGARSEGNSFTMGLAHMMEHMCFKGTENRDWQEIGRQVAFLGGHTNAFTSQEMVCYYIYVPFENIDIAMEILSDQVFQSTIPEEEFLKEREVVRQEEISGADDPSYDLYLEMGRRLMPGRLGKPVIGTKESIESFTHKELKKFYKRLYRRSNAVVSLAANCSKREGKRLLTKHFGRASKFSLSAPLYDPVKLPNELVVVERQNTEHTYACVCMPGLDLYDKEQNTMEIASQIMGGGMDSRLFTEVREKRGLAYSIGAYNSSHRELGHFVVSFQTEEDNLEEVIDVIGSEMKKIATEKVTEEELQRTKNKIRSQIYSTQDSTMGVTQDSLRRVMFNMDSLEQDMEAFSKITTDDVMSLTNRLFSDEKRLIVVCKDKQE